MEPVQFSFDFGIFHIFKYSNKLINKGRKRVTMSSQVTIVVNSPPYGNELAWNALRLAKALLKKDVKVNVFLLGDGVSVALRGQRTPQGYYNLEQTLSELVQAGVSIRACRTCCSARGIDENSIATGVQIGGIMDLAEWVKNSKQVLVF
jgi:uncharacterized protein involved in oxidation of intracellular sulfur